MPQRIANIELDETLREHLCVLLNRKDEMVAAVESIASQASGPRHAQLLSLADRLAFAEQASDVLRDSAILEIYLPLVRWRKSQSLQAGGPLQVELSRDQIVRSVHEYVLRQPSETVARNQIWGRLIYFAIVCLLGTLIFICFSIFVAPIFRSMYDEFGIILPAPTKLVLSMATLVTSPAIYLTVATVTAAAMAMRWWGRQSSRHAFTGFTSSPITSKRRGWGMFTRHLGLLLQAGIRQGDAISIAADAINQKWLGRHVNALISPAPKMTRHFYQGGIRQMRAPAPLLMQVLNWHPEAKPLSKDDQAACLFTIAEIYSDQAQGFPCWAACVTAMLPVLAGCIIGFFVIALMMPLVSLISGLS